MNAYAIAGAVICLLGLAMLAAEPIARFRNWIEDQ